MELNRVNERIGEAFLKAMKHRTDVDFTKKALVKVLDQVMNDIGLENGRIKSKSSNTSSKPLTKPMPTISETAIVINTPPRSPDIHPKTVYNTVIHNHHHTPPTAPNYFAAAAAYNNTMPHRNPFMTHNIVMEDTEMADVLPAIKRKRM
jgi:hypothetical protein